MRKTGLVIIGIGVTAFAVLMIYDLVQLLSGGTTVSQWSYEIAKQSPIIPCLFGLAAGLYFGHAFWPIAGGKLSDEQLTSLSQQIVDYAKDQVSDGLPFFREHIRDMIKEAKA